jgi:hydrogenase/urease accessory protein HupE
MNEFVNGLLHPLTSMPHVLVLVGLGLMAGRQRPLKLKPMIWSFAPVSALALALTLTGWIRQVHPAVLTGLALVAGAFLALDKIPPAPVMVALFAGAALFMGLDSAVEVESGWKQFKTLSGTWISLNAVLFDLAIYVSLGAQAKWLQIALRVVGSWIIAIALMVLAFSFRPGHI